MRCLTLVLMLLSFSTAHAEGGDWFFLPSVGIGYNSVQGNSMRLGVDLGMNIDANFYAGVGGYYASGSRPEHDRELGAGPFLGYSFPISSFLSLEAREDIDYVDQRTPVLISGSTDSYTHVQDHGVVSQTYGGVHISFSRNFGISAGYRAELGLSKASLATGRSGTVLGLTIGI